LALAQAGFGEAERARSDLRQECIQRRPGGRGRGFPCGVERCGHQHSLASSVAPPRAEPACLGHAGRSGCNGNFRGRLEQVNARAAMPLTGQESVNAALSSCRAPYPGSDAVMNDGLVAVYIFMLAAIAGHVIISRVPVLLHTPLMSGSNFIHGIVLIGAMVVLGHAQTPLEQALGFVAVLLGAGNAAGGYVVTERMLEMFKSSKKPGDAKEGGA